jgi:serine/threonine protein phosphatase PrpC
MVNLPNNERGMLFGIFDGHGGNKVALDAKKKLV